MMGSDRQLWAGMLAHLKAQQPTLCRQWFEDIEPLGIDSGVLRLRARTSIHRDYLRRQCSQPFNEAALTVSKHLLTIQFLGPEDELPRARVSPQSGNGRGPPEIKPMGPGAANGHGGGHGAGQHGPARHGAANGAAGGVVGGATNG